MQEALKPYVEAVFRFLFTQPWPLVIALSTSAAAWFYADLVAERPLNRYELIGFFILAFAGAYLCIRGFAVLRRLIPVFLIGLASLYSAPTAANDLAVIQIPPSGKLAYDLRALSLFQFSFPLHDLERVDEATLSEEDTDCLVLERRDRTDFVATFCGYGAMFKSGIGSLIVGSDGDTRYALDLYELEVGGGGGFGKVLHVPSTSLKNYLSRQELQLEFLGRAILEKDHKDSKKHFLGFGLYGFVLFRDKGAIDSHRKKAITDAFISILPDYAINSFGVRKENIGVLIYPSLLDDVRIYEAANLQAINDESCNDSFCPFDGQFLSRYYNYSYADYALRQIRHETRISVPAFSLVIVPHSAQLDQKKFFLSNFRWSESIVMDITEVNDYGKFFNDLNNFFVHDIHSEPSLFDQFRKFAESTGRLALIVFEKSG
ncbi:hypothetical protein [Nitratireductor alexandrii]|uniref:hypothetical protein n=1 Tax=Nitratireductor alexandrii TaxID=2448161 RepID=UPI000FDA3842|nr:hypothetical protein [Nitratireductor alexandrii]